MFTALPAGRWSGPTSSGVVEHYDQTERRHGAFFVWPDPAVSSYYLFFLERAISQTTEDFLSLGSKAKDQILYLIEIFSLTDYFIFNYI